MICSGRYVHRSVFSKIAPKMHENIVYMKRRSSQLCRFALSPLCFAKVLLITGRQHYTFILHMSWLRLHLKERTLGSNSRRNLDRGVGRAVAAEGLEPSTVVEFRVVLLDLAISVDLHVVDSVDGEWQGDDSPSPGNGVAVNPDVEDIDGDLRLEDTLTVVESGLAVEGDGAKLEEHVSQIQ